MPRNLDANPLLSVVPLWGTTRNSGKIHRVSTETERGLGEPAISRCGVELEYVWKASGRFRPSVTCRRCDR